MASPFSTPAPPSLQGSVFFILKKKKDRFQYQSPGAFSSEYVFLYHVVPG